MTPSLEEIIRAARRLHGRITPTYLLGQINGKIHKNKGVRDLLQRYVDKAGLADIHLHDFRAKAITDAKCGAMIRRRWPVTLRKRRQYAICATRKFRWYTAQVLDNNAKY